MEINNKNILKVNTFSGLRVVIYSFGILFFILTAYFSEGFFHPDEHFQILEPASSILEYGKLKDVFWELNKEIRPGFMPYLIFGMLRLGKLLGFEENRYFFMFIIRLLNAGLCFFLVHLLSVHWQKEMTTKDSRIAIYLSGFLIWWIPFLCVRFSSDVFGGMLFTSGWLIWQKYKQGKHSLPLLFMAGFLLGLSFQARYQMSIAIIAMFLFELFSKFRFWKGLLLLSCGILSSFMIGWYCDKWLYSRTVFPFINYFKINIIDGVAASFGTQPMYWYLPEFFFQSALVFGGIILLSLFYLIIKRKWSSEVCIVVIFFLVHSLISHKEIRFLFPLAFFMPFIISKALDVSKIRVWKNKFLRTFLIFILLFNIVLLLYNGTKSATTSFDFVRFFRNENRLQNTIVYIDNEKSIQDFNDFFKPFYGNRNCIVEKDSQKISNCDYIFNNNYKKNTFYSKFGKLIYSNPKEFLFQFNINDWISRTPQYYFFRIKK